MNTFALTIAFALLTLGTSHEYVPPLYPFETMTTARAPELFGPLADMQLKGLSNGRFNGFIKADGLTFHIVGTQDGNIAKGYLEQTGGKRVEDRACPTCPGYPIKRVRFEASVYGYFFQGRIYFRGHWRPFCGGIGFVPAGCLLKSPGT